LLAKKAVDASSVAILEECLVDEGQVTLSLIRCPPHAAAALRPSPTPMYTRRSDARSWRRRWRSCVASSTPSTRASTRDNEEQRYTAGLPTPEFSSVCPLSLMSCQIFCLA
jgi:hypothetical protein